MNEDRIQSLELVSLKMVREKTSVYNQRRVESPEDALEILKDFKDNDRENFVLLCLNTKNIPAHISVISRGKLDASLVHPREVFKLAYTSNSAGIIICHNHPSGIVTPSEDDIKLTDRLIEAGEILGIQVLDHLIISFDSYSAYSMNWKISELNQDDKS